MHVMCMGPADAAKLVLCKLAPGNNNHLITLPSLPSRVGCHASTGSAQAATATPAAGFIDNPSVVMPVAAVGLAATVLLLRYPTLYAIFI
jgi:hypothetical protein